MSPSLISIVIRTAAGGFLILAWGTDFTAARTILEGWNVDTENPTRSSTALFPTRIQRPISNRILTRCHRLDRDVDYDRLISAWSADLNG
jgi:hypothetical protein